MLLIITILIDTVACRVQDWCLQRLMAGWNDMVKEVGVKTKLGRVSQSSACSCPPSQGPANVENVSFIQPQQQQQHRTYTVIVIHVISIDMQRNPRQRACSPIRC
jgi:hypothetical protein